MKIIDLEQNADGTYVPIRKSRQPKAKVQPKVNRQKRSKKYIKKQKPLDIFFDTIEEGLDLAEAALDVAERFSKCFKRR